MTGDAVVIEDQLTGSGDGEPECLCTAGEVWPQKSLLNIIYKLFNLH